LSELKRRHRSPSERSRSKVRGFEKRLARTSEADGLEYPALDALLDALRTAEEGDLVPPREAERTAMARRQFTPIASASMEPGPGYDLTACNGSGLQRGGAVVSGWWGEGVK
jgi:hypothetical protein